MEHAVIGILAHVDAGKTTLSERILFESGVIRKTGRVDEGNAFLDTDETEKRRGITIYAKQAVFPAVKDAGRIYTLLDTPGHADFQAETERAVSVLDAAVLLIGAMDGVNAQVRLLYELLTHYRVPVFVFVNKMDQAESAGLAEERREQILKGLSRLSGAFVDFTNGPDDPDTAERIALSSEEESLLDAVMEGGTVGEEEIRALIRDRKLMPVFFGSALKGEGVRELLFGLDQWLCLPDCPDSAFSARVFKIGRDEKGERETWLKVIGGKIAVRDAVTYRRRDGGAPAEEEDGEVRPDLLTEKVNQIRIWSGGKYTTVPEAVPGMVCAVTGLTETYAGEGIGDAPVSPEGLLVPVITWEILPGQGAHVRSAAMYRDLSMLAEEDPLLTVRYDERKRELTVSLMGRVQREVIAERIERQFGYRIRYGRPRVIYKETIAAPVEGVGHFEPLRHYAEAHLLLTPGEEGSGLVFEDRCPPDMLPKQYRNQILDALKKRRFRGVLTGSEITDMKIAVVAGKAHVKHTEGGDFYQAASRALRQGLMMAENILLEPFYDFELMLPQDKVGRAMADLTEMGASFSAPEMSGENTAVLAGTAPVAAMDAYQETLAAYTKGEGVLSVRTGAYRPCRNAQQVIEEAGYDPELDRGQPTASVFCTHGAGTIVPWYEVRNYMHIDTGLMGREEAERTKESLPGGMTRQETPETFKERERRSMAAEAELLAIFERTYGPVKRNLPQPEERVYSAPPKIHYRKGKPRPDKQYLLVDGYNIIYAWENLREMAEKDVKAARDTLIDILSDYGGFVREHVICVYDAYRVPGGTERVERYGTIDVVYTKEAETADQYIEKAAHELGRQYGVRVATSDAIEQMIIYGAGAVRLSAKDFLAEVVRAKAEMKERIAPDVQVRNGHLHTSLGSRVEAAVRGASLVDDDET